MAATMTPCGMCVWSLLVQRPQGVDCGVLMYQIRSKLCHCNHAQRLAGSAKQSQALTHYDGRDKLWLRRPA